jgi:hypothetical protein
MTIILAKYPTSLTAEEYAFDYTWLGENCGAAFIDGRMPTSLLPFVKQEHSGSGGTTATITKTITVTAPATGTACSR